MRLEKFFNPKSVAIIGASRVKNKVGYEILKSMIEGGYEGEIFPVNPNLNRDNIIQEYPD